MRFEELELAGAHLVSLDLREDERGWFARLWDPGELREHGLEGGLAQASVAFNTQRSTLRGLHFQEEPHAEAKLVRCTRGALHDVTWTCAWNRPRSGAGSRSSCTRRRPPAQRRARVRPRLTLADETEALSLISAAYAPDASHGARWDDPAFGIEWPAEPE